MPVTAPVPLAYVMTSFEPGGTERQMTELIRRLDPTRWTVHVACFHARGAWLGRVAEAAASVTAFPLDSFRSLDAVRRAWGFSQWCRQRRIAVVHTTGIAANIFGLPSAALGGVPVRIGNRREINPDKTAAEIAAQRAAYAFAHKVVANSQAAADRLRLERVPARKIAVVPNGLDARQIHQRLARATLRTVVMVANLRPEKGHDALIDAAVDVRRRFPDARFELVGGGPERSTLMARADACGLTGVVSFAGHQEDVAARLSAADIFVLPSRSEAFPNAVLEAMGAGMPIIASEVGGIPELIDNERTGLLVPAGDSQALADRICRLMADPALGARLGDAACADAATRYAFDRMVSAFEGIYLSELARRGVRAAEHPQWAAS